MRRKVQEQQQQQQRSRGTVLRHTIPTVTQRIDPHRRHCLLAQRRLQYGPLRHRRQSLPRLPQSKDSRRTELYQRHHRQQQQQQQQQRRTVSLTQPAWHSFSLPLTSQQQQQQQRLVTTPSGACRSSALSSYRSVVGHVC